MMCMESKKSNKLTKEIIFQEKKTVADYDSETTNTLNVNVRNSFRENLLTGYKHYNLESKCDGEITVI